MTLTYTFDNRLFDYDIDPDFGDFFDFIHPQEFYSLPASERAGYSRACTDIFDADWFLLTALEDSPDFYHFMHARYLQDAQLAYELAQQDSDND